MAHWNNIFMDISCLCVPFTNTLLNASSVVELFYTIKFISSFIEFSAISLHCDFYLHLFLPLFTGTDDPVLGSVVLFTVFVIKKKIKRKKPKPTFFYVLVTHISFFRYTICNGLTKPIANVFMSRFHSNIWRPFVSLTFSRPTQVLLFHHT